MRPGVRYGSLSHTAAQKPLRFALFVSKEPGRDGATALEIQTVTVVI